MISLIREENLKGTILKDTILKYKKTFFYAFVFSFAINILTLAMPIYSLQVLDRVVSSQSLETLLMLSIIVCISFVFLGLLSIVRSFIFFKVTKKLDCDLSENILSNAIALSCIENKIRPNQLLRDFNAIKNFLSGQIMHTLFDAPWAIIFIIAIFFVHYINGIIVLVAALILSFIAYLNEYSIKTEAQKANESNLESLNYIEVTSRNSEVIEAMGMRPDIITYFNKLNNKNIEFQFRVNEKAVLFSSITKTIRLFIQMSMMGIGAYLVINRQMSGGGIIATSILAGKALAPFDAGIAAWKNIIQVRKSYERVNLFLSKTSQVKTDTLLPTPKGDINVEKVIFTPNKDVKPIIKGISFDINQGEVIGIIGPSGSGKTTLAKLLIGVLKPSSGIIRLDSADISKWDRTHLGKYIGYLPQDIELFAGDVKTNIACMKESPHNEAVLKAALLVNAHDLILRLQNGYETEVGVGGAYLSSGQAQRIALARAFYGDPKFIVLDEPNSHLDTQGEQSLITAIEHIKINKITTIIIVHRYSILSYVDKILVLQDGQIKLFDEREQAIEQLKGRALAKN